MSVALAALFPASLAVHVVSDPGDAALAPEEVALVADAVDKRRREFIAARRCAHRALELVGAPTRVIGVGAQREPLWPAGVIGSITHCDGFVAAAVARCATAAGLGIDAEPYAPLSAELVPLVCSDAELRAAPRDQPAWARVVFSAKESIYKCLFPRLRRFLEFDDVEVLAGDGDGALRCRVRDAPGLDVEVAWTRTSTHLFTAAWSRV